jgi:hypothetical protein
VKVGKVFIWRYHTLSSLSSYQILVYMGFLSGFIFHVPGLKPPPLGGQL